MDAGLLGTVLATQKRFDLVVRKNEPILGWFIGNVFIFVHFQNLSGLVELTLFGCAALGLNLAELSKGPFELAGETLAVDADLGEGAGVLTERQGHRECGFGLRMVGADLIFHFGDAEREEISLDSGGTVHAPGGVDERLDELRFGGVFRVVLIQEGLGVALISGVVLGGQDDGLACQSVAEGVHFRALLTGFGSGAGGFLCIRTINAGTLGDAVGAIGVCRFRNRIHDFGITRVGGVPAWWKLGSW